MVAGPVRKASNSNNNNDVWPKLAFKVATDVIFEAPAILLCEEHAATRASNRKTFRYRFDYDGGEVGAAHGIELPFLWGTHIMHRVKPELRVLVGDAGSRKHVSAAKALRAAWAHFFKSGDPNCAELWGHATEVWEDSPSSSGSASGSSIPLSPTAVWHPFSPEHHETLLMDVDNVTLRKPRVTEPEAFRHHRDGDEVLDIIARKRSQSGRAFGFIGATPVPLVSGASSAGAAPVSAAGGSGQGEAHGEGGSGA